MKKFIIRDREAGNVITWFDTIEEAQAEVAKYEADDKAEGIYEEDFYEIIDASSEEYRHILIKEIRRQTNLSQEGFSRLTGIPKRTIEDWERGVRVPPMWTVNLLRFFVDNQDNQKEG